MNQAVSNELEDFFYSAYNEFDWLNEKMEEVFSKDARFVACQVLKWLLAFSVE